MRIRVTGRFYLVLVLIVLLFVFLFRDSLFATSEVTSLYAGSASDVRRVQCMIVRDEAAVARGTQVDMIDYVSEECTPVSQGDVVCYVYTSAYASKLKGDLDDTRKKVQAYHKIVLGNELDSTLKRRRARQSAGCRGQFEDRDGGTSHLYALQPDVRRQPGQILRQRDAEPKRDLFLANAQDRDGGWDRQLLHREAHL